MTSKDNAQDEELLARYRRAGDTDPAAPSESVRSAILAESRRVAEQLAKKQHPFDLSRPAANDARWKITAFGTVGAAVLGALLFVPRFWESHPPAQGSSASSIARIAEPAAKTASADAAAPAPKRESISPSSPNESLQEVVVTQADRKASKPSAEDSRQYSAPAPSNPPSVAQNYARAPPAASPAYSGRAAQGGALSMSADKLARASLVPTPASLQAAAGLGDVRQAASLLDQGVAVDARDADGRTPLMLAVAQGRLEVVRLLLARGADPNAADNSGRTPLQQARAGNLRDVAALLERAGARQDVAR
jgi:hypothetical protein